MSEWKIKRTWDTVKVKRTEAGFLVALDDRPVVTPAKNPLLLPSNALANRVANEWKEQDTEVIPAKMPFTRLSNTALDKVSVQFKEVADILVLGDVVKDEVNIKIVEGKNSGYIAEYLEEKGFNISKALYQITKKGTLKNEELVEVLKFFLETNNFPKNLLHRRDELQSKIHTLFLSQEDRLWSILNEYSNKPNLFDRLFTFIDFRTLFNFIEKNRFLEKKTFFSQS